MSEKKRSFSESVDNFLDIAWVLPGSLCIGAGFFFGLGLLAYQAYLWLKTGKWAEYDLSFFLYKAGIDLTPVYSPQDWQGVASISRFFIDTQAGLGLMFIGIVLLLIGLFLQNAYSQD